ncbi:MAG: PGPGW domain-containing protein, partial [Porticoccaceae bacterium]|nr:PGPGW domain-containing protein [Porticoccaceae bacterium]
HLLVWMGVCSAAIFFISLLSLPWLVSKIPVDYFSPKKRQPTQWKAQRPVMRLMILIGKNCLGYLLLLGGILMLVLPGQGILTIATGLLLMDYPGKFRLERRVVKTPAVLKGLNWLRAKANQPPLQ